MNQSMIEQKDKTVWIHCVVILLAFITLGIALFTPVDSDDLFMYLTLGRKLWQGGFPTVDPFLFSLPNHPWHIAHEWGSYLLFYALYSCGGWNAIISFKVVLICMTAVLLLKTFPFISGDNRAFSKNSELYPEILKKDSYRGDDSWDC